MSRLGPPFTDVRITRPHDWRFLSALPGLAAVDLNPPASGPEVELTFGTSAGSEPADEAFIVAEVERVARVTVLAHRRRTSDLLSAPGPVRARALAAAAASLNRDVGLCGDRCRAAATHAIDAAVKAARRT